MDHDPVDSNPNSTTTRVHSLVKIYKSVINHIFMTRKITKKLKCIFFRASTELFVDGLTDVSVFAVIMTALEFTVSIPLEEFGCRAAFDCRPLALWDWSRVSQTWMPSYHVWRSFALPALPQFLNQEPPRPQQLLLPDFLMAPHVWHTGLAAVVIATAGIYIYVYECAHWSRNNVKQSLIFSHAFACH